jgi:predicted permease
MHIVLVVLLSVFTVFEIIANSVILVQKRSGKGFGLAKKIHGDFYPDAPDAAWFVKSAGSLILGIISGIVLIAYWNGGAIYKPLLYLFGVLIFATGLIQAVVYGKKHRPAFGGAVIGIVFLILIIFLKTV